MTMNPITKAIIDQIDDVTDKDGKNERSKFVVKSLIKHLHGFIEEIQPTQKEWEYGIDFLTQVGRRQEFILLSDVLGGSSILVDTINHENDSSNNSNNNITTKITESTILGPFYQESTRKLNSGDMITTMDKIEQGNPLLVNCQIVDGEFDDCNVPVTNATVNVWHASSDGLYDIQQQQQQPNDGTYSASSSSFSDLRGMFYKVNGRFTFRTVVPSSYPIPTDGPVGDLLNSIDKHPYRPAHIHFYITAPGFVPLVTHLFIDGDPYLETDVVHAVKDSLIVTLEKITDEKQKQQFVKDWEVDDDKISNFINEKTFYKLVYTFRLQPKRRRKGLNDRYLIDE